MVLDGSGKQGIGFARKTRRDADTKIMRGRASFRKPFLAILATLFAAVAIVYGSLWMYAVRYSGPRVELGFNILHNPPYDERTHSQSVEDVVEGSPAERAGLRVGDRIIGVNGRALDTDIASDEAYVRGRPGDPVEFTVERAGEPKPLILHGVFRAAAPARRPEGLAKSSALHVLRLFPIPFLLVAFAVLFLRLEEPNAWLLALLFCAFAVAAPLLNPCGHLSSAPRICVCFSCGVCGNAGSAFLSFFRSVPAAIASG